MKGKVLKQTISGTSPYQAAMLCVESKHTLYTVHKLVATAFLGPLPSDKHEVCHGPNGKQDNRPANLSYGTRSQNQFDRYRDGTGGNKPVRRSDGKEYLSAAIASRETGICMSTISAVCNKYVRPNGKRRSTAGGFSWEFI
jgi:hypothetical protein